MKKTLIILILIGIVFSSCSSSDGNAGEDKLQLIYSNFAGNWNVSKVIKANGSQVDYINLCPNQKDYVKFYTYGKMEFFQYFSNCNPQSRSEHCINYYFNDGYLENCNNFIDGKIVKLTATELIIDYQETRNFSYGENNMGTANGIVLTREQN